MSTVMRKIAAWIRAVAMFLAPRMKAVVAFLAPGVLVLADVLVTGNAPSGAVWLKAAGAALVTGLAVYRIPNKDPQGQHADESVQDSALPPGLQLASNNTGRPEPLDHADGYAGKHERPL